MLSFVIQGIKGHREVILEQEGGEIQEDEESNYSIFFNFKDFHLHGNKLGSFDPNYWEVLKNFSRINDLYVLVYDHNSKIRYGYWYDEEPLWVYQDIGDYLPYIEKV